MRALLIPLYGVLAAAGASAQLPQYSSFQLQARSNLLVNDNGFNLPPGSSFNSISAHIDEQARVSFPVQVVPSAGGGSHPGVWFGADGTGTLVFEGPDDALVSSETSHNAAGQIVFTLSDTGANDGIWRYDPAVPGAARVGTSPLFPLSYSGVRVNTGGAIGFQGNFSSGRALASTSTGNTLLHVADRALDPQSPWTFLYSPDFNDERRFAIKVATSTDATTATEIRAFASDGSSVRLAANQGTSPGSAIRQFDNGLSFNDLGQVAFVASRVSDQRRGLYFGNGNGVLELLTAQPGGAVTELDFFRPVLNNAGQVVFRGRDTAGLPAIFVAQGLEVRRVIGRGDLLATDLGMARIGQHNTTDPVYSGNPAINDRGDIVFIAALHPENDNQVEWGTGVFVAYADQPLFRNGFED